MGDPDVVADDDPDSADPYSGPSPYDQDTAFDRILAQFRARAAAGKQRDDPDPDNPYEPELDWIRLYARIRRTVDRVRRNPVPVADSEEHGPDDVDAFLRGGARFVPASAYQHRGADGLVILAERRFASIVFLSRGRLPVRAVVLHGDMQLVVSRVRAALGENPRSTTGPPIDDPRWRGIGVARQDEAVQIRLHTDEFDRLVILEPADARRLVEVLTPLLVPW